MFGCTRTLRKWTPEGKGSSSPTHVNMYDVEATKNIGLDREGMVLVALMSGGDYNVEGIPGCGPKIACEAARAGFGKTLCRLKNSDKEGIQEWKENLRHELQTNESKYFRRKNAGLSQSIPEEFPDMRVLRYYTHPVVSDEAILNNVKDSMEAALNCGIDIPRLREYTRENFDWNYEGGAIKYIRVISQAVLMQNLLHKKGNLVKRVSGRRTHFSTDATPELRISHIPLEVVPIDLSAEPEEPLVAATRNGLALNSDDDFEEEPASSGRQPKFDVNKSCLVSILEIVAKQLIPDTVADWEKAEQAKAESKLKKPARKKGTDKKNGTLDGFVQISKPVLAPNGKKSVPSIKPAVVAPSANPGELQAIRSRRPTRLPSSKLPDDSLPNWSNSRPPSSPTRPRTPRSQTSTAEDPIVIPSSPAVATTPTQHSPSKATEPARISLQETPSTGSRHMMPRERAAKQLQQHPSSSKKNQTHHKQSKLDVFLSSSQTIAKSSPAVIELDESEEESLPPLSSILTSKASRAVTSEEIPVPVSPRKRGKEPVNGETQRTGSRSPKKKIYIPRLSELGYFKEVDADEAEQSLIMKEARRNGRKAPIRMSDVDIVDLTDSPCR